MSTNHTPGPWNVGKKEESAAYGSRNVITRSNGLVAVAWSSFKGEQAIADANARLIAAAPDMLAALELTLDQCDLFPDVVAAVRAAIAKAVG